MEIISNGIAVFKNYFLRNEEVIDLADKSEKWRPGTVGQGIDPKLRITDIYDLDNTTELHKELLETFLDAINQYSKKYSHCRISKGEHLRIGRYNKGGHYTPHCDSTGSDRVLSGVLYLNNDFVGGELYFPIQDLTVKPEPGMLILFPSNFIYVHQALPVTDGKKYICLSWFA